MRILESYDLTGSYRAAAELTGVDHHTVKRYTELRNRGGDPTRRRPRAKKIDAFLPKIEELVDRSGGRIGADKVHQKITAMGFQGTDRTTRRAVAAAKASYRAGQRKPARPWIPEPGFWCQWEWAQGPQVRGGGGAEARGGAEDSSGAEATGGRSTWLWCAWLGWSRYRVVLPVPDTEPPTLARCLDTTLRTFGGVPTHALIGPSVPARGCLEAIRICHYYGLTVTAYAPATVPDAVRTVRIADHDLLPVHLPLRPVYHSLAELRESCREFTDEANDEEVIHRLTEERRWLRPLPARPYSPE
ncbi:hypothetical protein [Streptomyces sp. NPDC057545]|uniref:hypothetical protein n=1 Tax=Streptomyces sp. NPDC057545 TaxID=3346164 RepID=UPI0036A2FA33